jgi:hypothetical protein
MARSMIRRACTAIFVLATWTACAATGGSGFGSTDGGSPGTPGGDATLGSDAKPGSDAAGTTDTGPGTLHTADGAGGDATAAVCGTSATDLTSCGCSTPGTTRACYPNDIDAKSENVGTCKPGTQTCQSAGEFATWGSCVGAVTPATETCTGTVDTNCNAKVGCADPTCATSPSCMAVGCTDGQTRPCYEGAAATESTGTCKDGTQVCANGKWPTNCPGQVLPTAENCCDALDHNCNGLPGCFDFLTCFTASCCSVTCTSSSALSPGCVCPTGSGDTGTCPAGDHLVSIGGSLLQQQCCPCTTNDCDDLNCCGYDVCSASSSCAGIPCIAVSGLPASCNGQVSTDCDDWPEDCDEPCCLCGSCPGGP